jgi:hypothetical protein
LTEGAVLCEPFFQPAAVYSHSANPACFQALQAALAGCLGDTDSAASAAEGKVREHMYLLIPQFVCVHVALPNIHSTSMHAL